MSHYINVPVNENGILFDPGMTNVVNEAMAVAPFGFDDVFIYSHGWSTTAVGMMDSYNRFSVELASTILTFQGASGFPSPPRANLGIGIHWPSEITEDPNSPLSAFQLLTFYTMEHRADVVGRNAVYAMLRLLLSARISTGVPLRIFMLGHSFGCKVVCAALQDMQTDVVGKTIVIPPDTQFRVVLMEPATDENNLESGDIYGSVCQIPNLRILITKSQQDLALRDWYVAAGRLTNLFNPRQALGFAGPSQATVDLFGGADAFSLAANFTPTSMFGFKNRLVVVDLSAIHAARVASGAWPGNGPGGGLSGQHSDIFFSEIYCMVSGFLYSNANASPAT
ncbi:MAG TPA: hypothetical protein VHT92_00965 [Candidatus Cybelea sp.]|jgi:hypothetical protein|nr:hypothetical protein [Candidatus Cybelea sp.]